MATVHKFELVTGLHSVSDGDYVHAAKVGEQPVIVKSGDRLDEIFGDTKFKYLGDVEVPVAEDEKKAKK